MSDALITELRKFQGTGLVKRVRYQDRPVRLAALRPVVCCEAGAVLDVAQAAPENAFEMVVAG